MNIDMDYITKEKLESMYADAPTRKLMEVCKQSGKYEAEAKRLSEKADSIDRNLVETVKKKFPDIKDNGFMTDECELQISTMDKQWRLVSASMVTVKRSIQLSGFHSDKNLYVNSRYGIKEHKRYSGWSPFNYRRSVLDHANEDPAYTIEPNLLHINHSHGEDAQLRFGVLDNIPQLDQEKVDLLKRVTQETVWMIDSWRNFYNTLDVENIKTIKSILGMSSYISDRGAFMDLLNKLDNLVAFNKTLQAKVESQVAKWQPTIEKWQEANKNFMVLNELSKTDLKI